MSVKEIQAFATLAVMILTTRFMGIKAFRIVGAHHTDTLITDIIHHITTQLITQYYGHWYLA